MATPDDATPHGADLAEIRTQLNNLTASVRLICSKIDADNGTIGTDYVADVTDDAVSTAPQLIDPVYG